MKVLKSEGPKVCPRTFAVASATKTGPGDVGIQAKYQAAGTAGTGFAVAGDKRLPAERRQDLLKVRRRGSSSFA